MDFRGLCEQGKGRDAVRGTGEIILESRIDPNGVPVDGRGRFLMRDICDREQQSAGLFGEICRLKGRRGFLCKNRSFQPVPGRMIGRRRRCRGHLPTGPEYPGQNHQRRGDCRNDPPSKFAATRGRGFRGLAGGSGMCVLWIPSFEAWRIATAAAMHPDGIVGAFVLIALRELAPQSSRIDANDAVAAPSGARP